MQKLLRFLLLCGMAQLAASCQTDADIRPTNYDELALDTGHWEWDAWQNGFAGPRTPTSTGFTQQLTFGAGGRLTIRRDGQLLRRTDYQLSVGSFARCGQAFNQVPLVTFTSAQPLLNDDAKTYDLTHQNTQVQLTLTGQNFCGDDGATETYHWVKE
jgi:hypothetical protein